MNRNRIIIVIGLSILVLVAVVSAAEIPPFPCEFYGQVNINGQPAPVGALIEAKINGQTAGSLTTTAPGAYGGPGTFDTRLVVNGQANGDSITFSVNGILANQTATFQERNTQLLDLTISNGLTMNDNVTLTANITATQTIPVLSSGYIVADVMAVAVTSGVPTSQTTVTSAVPTTVPTTAATVQPEVTAPPALTQDAPQPQISNLTTPTGSVPSPTRTQSPGFPAMFGIIALAIIGGLRIINR
ncbi:MAG: hypothetical protein PHF64_03245 [Methanoregula sp.]|nr:hypothetical protein [Methanoregula sp.]